MSGFRRRRLIVPAAALAVTCLWAGRATAAAYTPPQFARETVLPGSGGAEPSIAIDYSSRDAILTAAAAWRAQIHKSQSFGTLPELRRNFQDHVILV